MDRESARLAVRALNHWRFVYQPSYIGLRLLLRQIPESASSDYIRQYLLHKLPLRQINRYRKFPRFKGFSQTKQINYRDMYAASPSTALGEAYALLLLSQIPSLRNRSYVYSYRWPKTEAGRSYSYFYSGYQERNQLITDLLRENPNYIVLVEDIRDFYPSVNIDTISQRLANHLESIDDEELRDYVSTVCYQVLHVAENGIPIGPALAHVFGNIALEAIDKEMHELLGDCYLRYVDDIVMLVEPNEVSDVTSKLKSLVESEGFRFNERKHDEVSSIDWLQNLPKQVELECGIQFDELINRIQLFLWDSPSKKVSLHALFRDRGIAIPIQRIALSAFYGRFHHYMRNIIRTARQYARVIKNLQFENEDLLLSDTIRLSKDFCDTAKQIEEPESTEHPIIRKWRTQRFRYLINRLFYLLPIDDYRDLRGLIPEIDEFYEHHCLINAVVDKVLDPVLQIPGPAVSTFTSIYQELEYPPIKYEAVEPSSMAVIDSICNLAVFDIVDLPSKWIESLSETDLELLRFCQFSSAESRIVKDHSFIDELRTLQLGERKEVLKSIIDTRFSDLEQINLSALLISGYSS